MLAACEEIRVTPRSAYLSLFKEKICHRGAESAEVFVVKKIFLCVLCASVASFFK
jgi:hypothetical protein